MDSKESKDNEMPKWVPSTNFDEQQLQIQRECDTTFGYYGKNIMNPPGSNLDDESKDYPPPESKALLKSQELSLVGQIKTDMYGDALIGRRLAPSEIEDTSTREMEITSMIRRAGMGPSVDEGLSSSRSIGVVSSDKPFTGRNFPILYDDNYFKLKPRQSTSKSSGSESSSSKHASSNENREENVVKRSSPMKNVKSASKKIESKIKSRVKTDGNPSAVPVEDSDKSARRMLGLEVPEKSSPAKDEKPASKKTESKVKPKVKTDGNTGAVPAENLDKSDRRILSLELPGESSTTKDVKLASKKTESKIKPRVKTDRKTEATVTGENSDKSERRISSLELPKESSTTKGSKPSSKRTDPEDKDKAETDRKAKVSVPVDNSDRKEEEEGTILTPETETDDAIDTSPMAGPSSSSSCASNSVEVQRSEERKMRRPRIAATFSGLDVSTVAPSEQFPFDVEKIRSTLRFFTPAQLYFLKRRPPTDPSDEEK